VRFEYKFSSLIPAAWCFASQHPLDFHITKNDVVGATPNKKNKLGLKKSYLLMSWISYLQQLDRGFESKSRKLGKISVPSLATLPVSRKFYTLTKAPMAHKTNSKEQYEFMTYNFKISVKYAVQPSRPPRSLLKALYLINSSKISGASFESNLLILDYVKASVPF
jgi:hypothetical protein